MVSIIIPIYNTKTYLKRCINSLLSQSYKNIELILVDDGSTDGTEVICDAYASVDSRIVVIHKRNGGEASARQAGLLAAKGEYVMFCDSDDKYLLDSVERLLVGTNDNGCDLCVSSYWEQNGEITRLATTSKNLHTIRELATRILLEANEYGAGYIMSTVNGKLFRNSIIRQNNVSFDTCFTVGSDVLFVHEYLSHSNTVLDILYPTYVYYKYQTTEYVQGMAWVYPDCYRLTVKVFENLLSLANLETENKKTCMHNLFDTVIRQMVRAAVYEKDMPVTLESELNFLVNHPLLISASGFYERKNESDSLSIPMHFKAKDTDKLAGSLRNRAKKWLESNVKSQYVRPIYLEKG